MTTYLNGVENISTTISMNPILDNDFLDKLYHTTIRFVYARVVALNMSEEPVEYIEGNIQSGNVNVDGRSAVRRTINLTMLAKELNIHNYYWGLNTKVEIYAGLENKIDSRYPEIIWFKQGTFVLTSFNTSQQIANYTISLQGKDKMVLLNGELGGTITSLSWDFGTAVVNGKYLSKEKILLKDIITDAVQQFAQMPFWKIQVNDLDDLGLELLEYRGDSPMYMIRTNSNSYNVTLNTSFTVFKRPNQIAPISLEQIEEENNQARLANQTVPYIFDPMFDLEQQNVVINPTVFYDDNSQPITLIKVEYGQTAGYRLTDLVYAGDLILNVGETITTLLDRIVQMLGEYEYFFDLDGQFVFQRKKIYLQTAWNNINRTLDSAYADPNAYSSDLTYSFTDAQLITNYSNSPNFGDIKNDFSIWGTKKGVSGKEVPVHMRFAIDDKPTLYRTYESNKLFISAKWSPAEQLEYIIDYLSDTYPDFKNAINTMKRNMPNISFMALMTAIYDRPANLNRLPQAWMTLDEWAEIWFITRNTPPTATLGALAEGHTPSDFESNKYFGGYNVQGSVMMLILNDRNEVLGGSAYSSYSQHYQSCGHSYDWWKANMKPDGSLPEGKLMYLYMPPFPPEVKTFVQYMGDYSIYTSTEAALNHHVESTDWRELIYLMAQDYNTYHLDNDFTFRLQQLNPTLCKNGLTGYEQYYVDMLGFWRELYDPNYIVDYILDTSITNSIYSNYILDWYSHSLNNTFPLYTLENNYKQCTAKTTWHKNIQYYYKVHDAVYDVDNYYPVQGLNQLIWEANDRTQYYYADTENPLYQPCLTREEFEDSRYWFQTLTNISTPESISIMSEQQMYGYVNGQNLAVLLAQRTNKNSFKEGNYNTVLENCTEEAGLPIDTSWVKVQRLWVVPCFKPIPHQSYYVYYTNSTTGSGEIKIPGTAIDVDEYYLHPHKYWRYENEYRKCTTEDIHLFSVDNDYYIKTQSARTGEITYNKTYNVTYERFRKAVEDNADDRYYVIEREHVKQVCYEIVIPAELERSLCVSNNINVPSYSEEELANELFSSSYVNNTIEAKRNRIENPPSTAQPLCWAIFGEFKPIIHPTFYKDLPTTNPDNSEITQKAIYKPNFTSYDEDGWVPAVTSSPESLNFWFDFLGDDASELHKYSNHVIGNRPKAVNDTNVKAIYYRETPTVIFVDSETKIVTRNKLGYTYINLPQNILSLFSISAQGKSAKTVLDQYLYEYACCKEQISFTTLPYYHLEPNKRIFVSCPESGITGEYILTNFSVPLGVATSMQLTATKAITSLY